MPDTDEKQKITETLYQHNLELVVKNKTLALLEKLYQTSISNLAPEAIAKNMCVDIREELNMEFVGIFNFKKENDTLEPLAFSKTDRLIETLNKFGFLFTKIKIPDVSKQPFLKKVIYNQNSDITDNLEEIWGGLIKTQYLKKIKEESHIKTILLYPLLSGNEVLQVLIMGLNREYQTLNNFEKSSISSFTNVIALSLSKAYLYEDLQNANESLKKLIQQRESLVHLITHKVKGSFTHTKYIFAEMIDGTFGVLTPELKQMAEKGLESDNTGIETIDLVLNAANLQKGSVKYDMKVLDFQNLVEKTILEKKLASKARGLELETQIKNDTYNVLGDCTWLKEAVNNLIENSIKYTKVGKIIVSLEKRDNKVLLSVKDTGVGITDEDKKNLFTEGGRGKDSVKVNVDSTGYGLYSVKLIVEEHKGRVWAESGGVDKGSTFFLELPIVG